MLVCDSNARETRAIFWQCVSPSLMCCHTEACILSLAESWPGEGSGMAWTLKTNWMNWWPWIQLTISHSSLLFCCTHCLHLAFWFANVLPCIAFPLCHCVACGLSSLLLHPQPHNQQKKGLNPLPVRLVGTFVCHVPLLLSPMYQHS